MDLESGSTVLLEALYLLPIAVCNLFLLVSAISFCWCLLFYTGCAALQVLLNSPMLLESELEAITSQAGMMNKTFNLHYESGKPGALKAAVETLCRDVEEAVKNGCEV